MIIEPDDKPEGGAQPGIEAGLAGERHRRVFDRQISQVKRLAERQKSDDQQDIELARGR